MFKEQEEAEGVQEEEWGDKGHPPKLLHLINLLNLTKCTNPHINDQTNAKRRMKKLKRNIKF